MCGEKRVTNTTRSQRMQASQSVMLAAAAPSVRQTLVDESFVDWLMYVTHDVTLLSVCVIRFPSSYS